MPLDKIPTNTNLSSSDQKRPHQPVGPLIGILIIIVLLIVGGLYFWGEKLNRQNTQPTYIPGDATESGNE